MSKAHVLRWNELLPASQSKERQPRIEIENYGMWSRAMLIALLAKLILLVCVSQLQMFG